MPKWSSSVASGVRREIARMAEAEGTEADRTPQMPDDGHLGGDKANSITGSGIAALDHV